MKVLENITHEVQNYTYQKKYSKCSLSTETEQNNIHTAIQINNTQETPHITSRENNQNETEMKPSSLFYSKFYGMELQYFAS